MSDNSSLYPWGGRFKIGDRKSCTAVVTLSEEFDFPSSKIALYGSMKTENLGVEKVVANIISNENIRFLVVCGTEVRGHRSGDSLISLHSNGKDTNNRVIGAKSAIPFIENLPNEAVERFRQQVEIINLINELDPGIILSTIDKCAIRNPGPFGQPMVLPLVAKEKAMIAFHGDFTLHSKLDIDLYGVVAPSPEAN
jgi:tetrahydromethanopterin S-methyltransferase subunit A